MNQILNNTITRRNAGLCKPLITLSNPFIRTECYDWMAIIH